MRPRSSPWHPSRRTVLRSGLSAATLAALAACGSGSAGASSADEAIKLEPDGDVKWFGWAEYVDPSVIKGFEAKYDVKVKQSFFDSDEAMLQKVAAGVSYDLVIGNSAYLQRMVDAKLLRKLPFSKMSNRSQVIDYFSNPEYDPGAKYSLPYGYGPTGMGYDVAAVGSQLTGSWNDLWTLAAGPMGAKVFLLDQIEETLGMALVRDGAPIDSSSSSALAKATKDIMSIKGSIGGFSTDALTKLSNGSAVLHHGWITDAVQAAVARKDPASIGFQLGKEGSPVGVDIMTIPTSAKAPGSAALLINWIIAADNSAKQAAFQGQAVGTTAGNAVLTKTLSAYPHIASPTDVLASGKWKTSLTGKRRQEWNTAWNQIKAG